MLPADIQNFFDRPQHARPTKAELRKARRLLKTAKKVEKQPMRLMPKNEAQREYLETLREENVIFSLGPAGTGKTYVAARFGMEQLLDEQFEKLVVTRPLVPVSNENVGFLPGKLEDKVAPWAVPVYDAFVDSVGSKEKLNELIRAGRVEFAPFAFIRGRTFSGAYVLADESQNLTVEQFKVLITRIGEGSKLVINGDLRQSDIRGTNGLKYGINLAEKYDLDCEIFEFRGEDVVRSGIVAEWVNAFERFEDDHNHGT